MADRRARPWLHDITFYLMFIIVISTIGSLQFGFHLAELNAPQDVITCRKDSIWTVAARWLILSRASTSENAATSSSLPSCIPMAEVAFATISSMFTLGGLIGALCAGPLSSSRGRLPTMRATAFLYMIGSLVETLSGAVALMAVGRLVSGIAAGASTVIVPLYISEVAPPSQRGLFGAMTQISINVGILVSQTLGYFLSHGAAWRWILAAGVLIATVQAAGSLAITESPAWLAANGHVARAKRTLQRIRGKSFDIKEETQNWDASSDGPGEEAGLLSQTDEAQSGAPGASRGPVHLSVIDVVRDAQYRPAIIAVVGIMFTQQLCGINSIIMYSVSLLADLLPISSALLTILISVVNLGTTVACSPLPDRLGRKTCLLISTVGQGSSSLVLAFSIVYDIKILSAISVLFFVAFFAVGLGPVPFILASEMVDQPAVGATQSWALGANYIATFIVAQFFPIINTALNNALGGHGWVYYLFAALAAMCAVFVSWRVPETKGKKDMDEVWGRERRVD